MKQEINLLLALPVRVKSKFPAQLVLRLLLAWFVLLLIFSLLQFWQSASLGRKIDSLQQAKSSKIATLSSLQAKLPTKQKAAVEEQITALVNEVTSKKKLLAVLQQKQELNTKGFSRYLQVFAEQINKETWLQKIELNNGGSHIALHGQSISAVNVLNFISVLDADPIFDGQRFNLVSLDQTGVETDGLKTFSFEVKDE